MEVENEIDSKTIKKVIKALEKKAIGYETREITEEYVASNGVENLVKKKVCIHYVPADISATKLLIELCSGNGTQSFEGLSDKELDEQAVKLFKEYEELSELNNIFKIKGEEN